MAMLAAGLLGWAVASTAGAGPAGAAVAPVGERVGEGGGEELAVDGSFAATGIFESTTDCPSFHTVHTGDGSWSGLGDVTFVLDYCVRLAPSGESPLSGSLTITAADGTLTGTVEGALAGGPDDIGYPADYTATITGGTEAYADATGSLNLTGHWDDPELPVLSMHGTVTGAVELPAPALPHPTTIRDCLHGGWRHVVDDDGAPFGSAGHCILYVIVHWRR